MNICQYCLFFFCFFKRIKQYHSINIFLWYLGVFLLFRPENITLKLCFWPLLMPVPLPLSSITFPVIWGAAESCAALVWLVDWHTKEMPSALSADTLHQAAAQVRLFLNSFYQPETTRWDLVFNFKPLTIWAGSAGICWLRRFRCLEWTSQRCCLGFYPCMWCLFCPLGTSVTLPRSAGTGGSWQSRWETQRTHFKL